MEGYNEFVRSEACGRYSGDCHRDDLFFTPVTLSAQIATEINKSRWTGERIARLGFLLGLGWGAKRIAEDPIIASTPNNVHRQAQRFGLAFRAAAVGNITLSGRVEGRLDNAAKARNITREALIGLLLSELGTDPNLLDNILDDRG